jgi:hypothetical protein
MVDPAGRNSFTMHSRVYRSRKAGSGAVLSAVVSDSICGMLKLGTPGGVARLEMTFLTAYPWEIAAAAALFAALAAVAAWRLLRKRPTAEELERSRRQLLSQSGRIVDGMLLDVCEVDAPTKNEAGRTLTMLLFRYRIGGVDYECSQEITHMSGIVNAAQVRAGFPCSVRYQPGNPQNSIIIAEEWSGLRAGIPVLPAFEDPDPLDTDHLRHTSHLRPGRG